MGSQAPADGADPNLALGAGEHLLRVLAHVPESVLADPRVRESALAAGIANGAKIIFDACSVGGGGKHRRNLVNCLAEVWPQAWLQAAWYPSSAGNRLLYKDDGSLDRMDFRNADTLGAVPYHVVAPTRVD